jgi:hypothetical protein
MTGFVVRAGRNLTVGVAVLALASCGSGKGDGAAGRSPSTPSRSTPSPSPSLRPAADGTRLNACKDGTCEVRLTGPAKIPVAPKAKVASLKVKSFGPSEISLTAIAASTPTGYEFSSSCEGDPRCTTSMDNDKVDVTAHTGAKVTLNRLAVQVVSVTTGSAVLRLTPA